MQHSGAMGNIFASELHKPQLQYELSFFLFVWSFKRLPVFAWVSFEFSCFLTKDMAVGGLTSLNWP